MRLVTYKRFGEESPGVLMGDGDGVLALADDAARAHDPALPRSIQELLERGEAALERAREAVASGALTRLSRDEVTLLAPLPRPRTLLCIGYNYRGHDGDKPDPEHPDVFAKASESVIGADASIVLPPESQRVDYEGELGVVIGATVRRVPVETALEAVAGYTIVNDVSARDVQQRGSQWTLGKSFDTFGPMGPALVTRDEAGDVGALEIEVRCNGQLTVSSSTEHMIFDVPWLVSYLSQVTTLRPGDVIATGTPGKLPGPAAEDRHLRDGDVVSITYGGIGTLSNRVKSTTPGHDMAPERKARA